MRERNSRSVASFFCGMRASTVSGAGAAAGWGMLVLAALEDWREAGSAEESVVLSGGALEGSCAACWDWDWDCVRSALLSSSVVVEGSIAFLTSASSSRGRSSTGSVFARSDAESPFVSESAMVRVRAE
ncbi:hypothetical protein FH972_022444 [Carpinus fangiana]|uniref:Uncharacterized protein n=1 Tax=Carpinus fangiana TaxID=176857 RepID=A0A5N6KSY1_9ROSI|nr:hypothetical protein FH972_022444 [Carpinus fangiana]